MKELKRIFYIIIFLLILLFFLEPKNIFASNTTPLFQKVQYLEEFQKWLELKDEEKNTTVLPQMYNSLYTNVTSQSPIYLARMLRSNMTTSYNLKTAIPANLYLRDQKNANLCWAISTLTSLETNLALYNSKRGINSSLVYDYSERHVEYATSKFFANNVQNPVGYNRTVGSGGQWYIAQSYLTNGSGAINENEMPFQNDESIIDIDQIKGKTVTSQVYDTVDFANYLYTSDDNRAEIMEQIKQHIQNYGSVYATTHSNYTPFYNNCYNNSTGAHYCSNSSSHLINHAISIIGWDDNYSISNFSPNSQPLKKGAWIVQNSWGETIEYTLTDFKYLLFNAYPELCISNGFSNYTQITKEFIQDLGFTINNDIVYSNVGNNGIIYVSYEDCNISSTLFGIVKSRDYVNYENLYQYDKYYPASEISFASSKIILANVFNKKSAEKEFITQVSLYVPETYTCKVYVNPNGTTKTKDAMTLVKLKAGESETLNQGYHTLEFLEPVEITGNNFVVLVEIQGTRTDTVNFRLESKLSGLSIFDSVTVESGKCFISDGNDFDNCVWYDLGSLSEIDSSLPDGDSSIKVFTVSEVLDESVKSLEIITPPSKLSYIEGDNFVQTGMVVKVNFNNNTSGILDSSSYNITNGTNLKENQTSVTITYDGKSIEQSITVEKNTVQELKIKTPPNNTEYIEGQNFDDTGMIIEATYKNKDVKIISDYIIENGENIKGNQTSITIYYEGKTVEQHITVHPNELLEINVTKVPDKTEYIVGQDFNKSGMVVTGLYANGDTQSISNYEIENGFNLTKNQEYVTISYQGKTTTQSITVVEKNITEIVVYSNPTKLSYIKNKENLNLAGGIIKVNYNDGTSENIEMISDKISVTGFTNNTVGNITINISYQGKNTHFDIEIIEDMEEKAQNSVLDNAICDVKQIKAYYFTYNPKEDYILIDIEINNIIRNSHNDTNKYYYYLSSIKNEKNIMNWVEITESQNLNDKLIFSINSKDITNYEEISTEEVLYLYIKEVAIKGGNQSISIVDSLSLEANTKIETYIDNVKGDHFQSGDSSSGDFEDNTIAPDEIPQTGVKMTIVILFIIMLCIGIIIYIKYKIFSDSMK